MFGFSPHEPYATWLEDIREELLQSIMQRINCRKTAERVLQEICLSVPYEEASSAEIWHQQLVETLALRLNTESSEQTIVFTIADVETLFIQIHPEIQRFLSYRLNCPDTAEELVQELFFKLPLLDPIPQSLDQIRAWIFSVAGNLANDWLRIHRRRSELLELYWTHSDNDDDHLFDRQLLAEEQLKQIQQALLALPDQCADILFLSRVEGLTNAKIAQELGISLSWVEKNLARALTHLRQTFSR